MAKKAKEKKLQKAAVKTAAPLKPAGFQEGMTYPWNRAKGLLNIFWALIPIIGWLALLGYMKTIVQELVKGNTKELPLFGNFWENVKSGFWVFLMLIPLYVVAGALSWLPIVGWMIAIVLNLFFVPYLVTNFLVKGEFKASFEVSKAAAQVFNNIGDYVMAMLKTLAFCILYGLLSIVLVGIPALEFGHMFYLADFYRRHS